MAVKSKKIAKMEPELRLEYIKKLKKIQKGKHIKIGSIEDFRKEFGLN